MASIASSLYRHLTITEEARIMYPKRNSIMGSSTYTITNPPEALRKAKLDNIALVPASLLPLKGTYQPLANKLPKGSVLCVQNQSQRHQRILASVAQFFRKHGHTVINLPVEKVTHTRNQEAIRPTETLRLAL